MITYLLFFRHYKWAFYHTAYCTHKSWYITRETDRQICTCKHTHAKNKQTNTQAITFPPGVCDSADRDRQRQTDIYRQTDRYARKHRHARTQKQTNTQTNISESSPRGLQVVATPSLYRRRDISVSSPNRLWVVAASSPCRCRADSKSLPHCLHIVSAPSLNRCWSINM